MVESANDCANAIAQAVSGNLTDFAELMNQQVAALGLSDTHFTNAHGLPDKDHYTTAYDMARITRWAMTVPGFEEYFCATEYTIPKTNKKDVARNIGTHHHMLVESAYYYPYAKGGKLGWTHRGAAYGGDLGGEGWTFFAVRGAGLQRQVGQVQGHHSAF